MLDDWEALWAYHANLHCIQIFGFAGAETELDYYSELDWAWGWDSRYGYYDPLNPMVAVALVDGSMRVDYLDRMNKETVDLDKWRTHLQRMLDAIELDTDEFVSETDLPPYSLTEYFGGNEDRWMWRV